jgi:anti-anti-sigma regulatory factor
VLLPCIKALCDGDIYARSRGRARGRAMRERVFRTAERTVMARVFSTFFGFDGLLIATNIPSCIEEFHSFLQIKAL